MLHDLLDPESRLLPKCGVDAGHEVTFEEDRRESCEKCGFVRQSVS